MTEDIARASEVANESAVVSAEGVRFAYRGDKSVPDAVPFALQVDNWRVVAGERWALYGPSGCGKSTLLDLVAGSLVPDAGRLRAVGLDMAAASEAERRSHRVQYFGFVFQDFPLVGYLDVLDNVLLPYRLHPALELDDAARQRAHSLLEELELATFARRLPASLSQGERQRVAIARALVTEPTLVLADEPTAGLDRPRAERLITMLERLSTERQLTLLLVTHERWLIDRFARTLDVEALNDRAVGG